MVAALLGYYLAFAVWPSCFSVLGLSHGFGWFFDSYAVLAANDAVAAGLDPYAVNPLDKTGRPHVYSHWWLGLSHWGWTRQDNFLFGGIGVMAFFGTVFAWLRPKSFKEAGVYFALLASPAVVLGVERANNDLFIFAVLAAMVPLLASRSGWVRWLALAPWVAATLLKFYPAAGIAALLMAGRRREVVARGLAAVGLLVLIWFNLRSDLAVLGPIIPRPTGLLSQGAPQVFMEMGLAWVPAVASGLVAGGVALVLCWRSSRGVETGKQNNVRGDEIAFVLGAVILVGCFFMGAGYAYRYVHTLLAAPWLWRLAHAEGTPGRVRKVSGWALGLLVPVLWFDGMVLSLLDCFTFYYPVDSLLALADRVAFWRQPLVWALMVCMLWLLVWQARSACCFLWSRDGRDGAARV